MNLNKIKLYNPTSSSGGVVDQPFSDLWAGDGATGRSANSIYNLVQSLGKFSRIIVVDAVYGNDYSASPPMQSGQRESVIRPFKTLNVAIYYMQANDVMVIMPGSYSISNFPGLTPKTNNTFLLINATLTYSGGYSPFFIYPTGATGVKVIGLGNSSIVKYSRNGWGGIVTPYAGPCDIEFHNLTLTAPEQAFAGLGAGGGDGRIVDFYNCRIYQNDSQVQTGEGGGSGGSSTYMKNCYVKGYTYLAAGNTITRPQYNLRAEDCFFEAIDTNSNGKTNCLDFGEYYGNTSQCNLVFERCSFKSNNHVFETGLGYGGLGTNRKFIIYDCKFVTGNQGWIINNHPDFEFKLVNNKATFPASGNYPINNLLSSAGITIEPNLEIIY